MEAINKQKTMKNYLTPAQKKRRIDKVEYCLFVLGLTQKETAGIVGVSINTINNWVKNLGWAEKLKGFNKAENCKDLKFKDSLSGFMVYLKKKHPTKYKNIQPTYNTFINSH